ncbi:MAG: hypothetical protein WA376_18200 [Terrimicrobiaceae bacterium]
MVNRTPYGFLVILFAVLQFHRSGEYVVFSPELKTQLNKDEVSALHGGIEAFLTKYDRPAHRQILVSKAGPGDWITMRSDGAEAVAIHGFDMLVRFPNGEQSGFRLIEEGIAEMLAVKADSNYTVAYATYHRLGNLSIILVNALEMRPEEVQDHLETNDLWWFVNRILGRHRQGRNPEDIVRVMNAYQKVANGSEPIAVARELIRNYPK